MISINTSPCEIVDVMEKILASLKWIVSHSGFFLSLLQSAPNGDDGTHQSRLVTCLQVIEKNKSWAHLFLTMFNFELLLIILIANGHL